MRAQRIDWDHTRNNGARPWPAVDLSVPGTVTIRATGLAFDTTSTSHWCAGIRNDANTSYRVHKLGYTGNLVETGTLPLAANATPRALAVTFNPEGRTFPVVFAENDGSSTTLDLPEALAPMTLTMQWVYLVPGANALGLQASEGLSVPIAR